MTELVVGGGTDQANPAVQAFRFMFHLHSTAIDTALHAIILLLFNRILRAAESA